MEGHHAQTVPTEAPGLCPLTGRPRLRRRGLTAPARCRLQALVAAASAWIAVAQWQAHLAVFCSRGTAVAMRLGRPPQLRRVLPPRARQATRSVGSARAARGPRTLGPRARAPAVRRQVFSQVFQEVAEQVEEKPAIFMGEIFAVIALSALFEKAEYWLRNQLTSYGDRTGKRIIDALFKEVTVLGFIGLLLFLLTRSGLADVAAATVLGSRDWGVESDNPLAETFETVHIMIFMLLVVLLFQSLAVLVVTRQVSECWSRFERSRAFGSEEASIETQFVKAGYIERKHDPHSPRQTELDILKPFTYGHDFAERLQLRQDRLHKLVMFRAIRHEFLYPRKENRKDTARVRDPALFSFSDYLRFRLGETVVALVEINVGTWVATLALLVPILYFSLQLSDVYAQAIQCGLAWLLVVVGVGLTVLLEEDTYKFTPQVPEDPRQTLRLFAGTSTQMLRRASQVARTLEVNGQDQEKESQASLRLQSSSGKRYRPGLGDAEHMPKPKLVTPPFYQVEPGHPTRVLYLSSVGYEQALRVLGFLQAISVTVLIVAFLSSNLDDPVEVAFYLLTWAEWPVMLFKVVPMLLRRLTIRNSIEAKKDEKAIRRVSQESNDGLLRDFLLLVRLSGLARRAAEERIGFGHAPERVASAVQEFNVRLSPTEQSEVWNVFAVWDADNTGLVEPREVACTFKTMGFQDDVALDLSHNLLRVVDDDGSGCLTWRKLKAATVLATFDSPDHEVEADLETFYELMDENDDGRISVYELTRGMRRMRIGLQEDDMANLLYRHFGTAKLKVSKTDFVDWAKSIGALQALRTAEPVA